MENENLIRVRILKAKRRLEAARLLLENDFIDDTLSKSYYAIFAAANAMLASKGLHSKKHSGVIKLFSLHVVKNSAC